MEPQQGRHGVTRVKPSLAPLPASCPTLARRGARQAKARFDWSHVRARVDSRGKLHSHITASSRRIARPKRTDGRRKGLGGQTCSRNRKEVHRPGIAASTVRLPSLERDISTMHARKWGQRQAQASTIEHYRGSLPGQQGPVAFPRQQSNLPLHKKSDNVKLESVSASTNKATSAPAAVSEPEPMPVRALPLKAQKSVIVKNSRCSEHEDHVRIELAAEGRKDKVEAMWGESYSLSRSLRQHAAQQIVTSLADTAPAHYCSVWPALQSSESLELSDMAVNFPLQTTQTAEAAAWVALGLGEFLAEAIPHSASQAGMLLDQALKYALQSQSSGKSVLLGAIFGAVARLSLRGVSQGLKGLDTSAVQETVILSRAAVYLLWEDSTSTSPSKLDNQEWLPTAETLRAMACLMMALWLHGEHSSALCLGDLIAKMNDCKAVSSVHRIWYDAAQTQRGLMILAFSDSDNSKGEECLCSVLHSAETYSNASNIAFLRVLAAAGAILAGSLDKGLELLQSSQLQTLQGNHTIKSCGHENSKNASQVDMITCCTCTLVHSLAKALEIASEVAAELGQLVTDVNQEDSSFSLASMFNENMGKATADLLPSCQRKIDDSLSILVMETNCLQELARMQSVPDAVAQVCAACIVLTSGLQAPKLRDDFSWAKIRTSLLHASNFVSNLRKIDIDAVAASELTEYAERNFLQSPLFDPHRIARSLQSISGIRAEVAKVAVALCTWCVFTCTDLCKRRAALRTQSSLRKAVDKLHTAKSTLLQLDSRLESLTTCPFSLKPWLHKNVKQILSLASQSKPCDDVSTGWHELEILIGKILQGLIMTATQIWQPPLPLICSDEQSSPLQFVKVAFSLTDFISAGQSRGLRFTARCWSLKEELKCDTALSSVDYWDIRLHMQHGYTGGSHQLQCDRSKTPGITICSSESDKPLIAIGCSSGCWVIAPGRKWKCIQKDLAMLQHLPSQFDIQQRQRAADLRAEVARLTAEIGL